VASTYFPSLEELLYLHALLIERFGGDAGVRDPGLLESALARPRSGYYRTLSEQAAALMQSLAMNHGFMDGNKRIALALSAVFLRLNGWHLETRPTNAERFIKQRIIEGHAEVQEIAAWLERHLTPLKQN
jgi:death on curing protein